MKNWHDIFRADLNSIPFLQSKGFAPVFHYEDRKYNKITPDNCPSFTVEFKNNNGEIIRLLSKLTPTNEMWGISQINVIKEYWILILSSGTKEADKIENLFNI